MNLTMANLKYILLLLCIVGCNMKQNEQSEMIDSLAVAELTEKLKEGGINF